MPTCSYFESVYSIAKIINNASGMTFNYAFMGARGELEMQFPHVSGAQIMNDLMSAVNIMKGAELASEEKIDLLSLDNF